MSRRTRTNTAGAFTIVELLVVVSIVATLMAILAPTLTRARAAARATVCGSNIRQLTLANDLHADDHTGAFVAGAKDFLGNLHRWHGARASRGDPFDAQLGAITPYLDGPSTSAAVRACPAFEHTLETLAQRGAGFEIATGGYGYNNAFAGVRRAFRGGAWRVADDSVGALRTRFMSPAQSIGFTDAAFASDRGVHGGIVEYSFVEPRFWPDSPAFRPDPSQHFRHARRASVAWLDGHVSLEARTHTVPGWFASVDSDSLGLGWAGVRDDNSLFDYD